VRQETVNGSEVTAMLAETAAAQDADTGQDPNLGHDIGMMGAAKGEKVGSGNGHEPTQALTLD